MVSHLTSVLDLTAEEVLDLIDAFDDPLRSPDAEREFWEGRKEAAVGKILISLFLQPSTRTRTSFNASFLRMGGNCIHFSSLEETLAESGESIEDTGRFLSQYGDLIVIRTYDDNMPPALAQYSDVPVISAGHGKREHPTAAINHLHTVYRDIGRLKDLRVLIAAKHPKRCINSFVKGLSLFDRNTVAVIDSHGRAAIDTLERDVGGEITFLRFSSPEAALKEVPAGSIDVLVFDEGEEDYQSDLRPAYFFDEEQAQRFRPDVLLLHFKPLLRTFSDRISAQQLPILAAHSRKSGMMRAHLITSLLTRSHDIE